MIVLRNFCGLLFERLCRVAMIPNKICGRIATGRDTMRKVYKYRVFSGLYIPIFDLDMEIYRVNLLTQSKYDPQKLDIFHAMRISEISPFLRK